MSLLIKKNSIKRTEIATSRDRIFDCVEMPHDEDQLSFANLLRFFALIMTLSDSLESIFIILMNLCGIFECTFVSIFLKILFTSSFCVLLRFVLFYYFLN